MPDPAKYYGEAVNVSQLFIAEVTGDENGAYICSKAVPITPLATYKIPADFNGGAIVFNAQGARSGFIHPVAYDGYKTVTSTVSTQYYMVFYAHIPTYTDYENMTVELMP